MPSREEVKVPYLGGRSFFESIIYTLTYVDLKYRLETGTQSLGFIVSELERHLCGLAMAVPQVKQIYHEYVKKALEARYKDYPLPDLDKGGCHVRNLLIEWFKNNVDKLYPDRVTVIHPEKLLERVAFEVDSILHSAILGALYKSGFLSHA